MVSIARLRRRLAAAPTDRPDQLGQRDLRDQRDQRDRPVPSGRWDRLGLDRPDFDHCWFRVPTASRCRSVLLFRFRRTQLRQRKPGLFGFLTKKSERGKAKVAVDDISKGILEDGLNLKENNNSFEVNGDGEPTLADFNKFISEFSDYVGKEIAGVRLGEADSDNVKRVNTYKYKESTRTESGTPKSWLTNSGKYLKSHFHTHPYNDHTPSEKDKGVKASYPDLIFYIIAEGNEEKIK